MQKRRRGKFVFLVHDLPLLDHSQAPSFSLCVIYDEKECTTMKENFLSSSKLLPVFPAKILSSLSTNKCLILVNVKTFFFNINCCLRTCLCLLLQCFKTVFIYTLTTPPRSLHQERELYTLISLISRFVSNWYKNVCFERFTFTFYISYIIVRTRVQIILDSLSFFLLHLSQSVCLNLNSFITLSVRYGRLYVG